MGEIAEMMLEGILCEGCGEYMDDDAEAGFPRRCYSCERRARIERDEETVVRKIARPRGRDKDASKDRRWLQDIENWRGLIGRSDCTIEPSPHKFEIANIRGDGVRLCIYPYRAASGAYYPRIRDQASPDPKKAFALIKRLGLHCKRPPEAS